MAKSSWVAGVARVVLALAMSSGASAAVMTFDTVPEPTTFTHGQTFVESGLQAVSYSNYSVLGDSLNMLPTNALYFHGNDGSGANTAGVISPGNAYIEFSRADGGHLDLLSLDLVSGGNYGTPSRRWITTSAGSTYWPQFQDSATVVHLTFSGPNYSDITWFRVGTVWFATELDNVTFNAVPEPATLTLLSAGALGLIGVVRRMRSK